MPSRTNFQAMRQKPVVVQTRQLKNTPVPPPANDGATADAADANFGPAEISAPDLVQPDEVPVSAEETQSVEQPVRTASDDGSFLKRALLGRSLMDDISTADEGSVRSANILSERHSELIGALYVAYPIFLHLLSGEKAFKALQNHPHYAAQADARKRKLSKNKPELLAVQFVLRPQKPEASKACSDYATYLLLAEDRKIAPCDFVEDMADVSLREAKTFASTKRKKERACDRSGGQKGPETGPDMEGNAPNDISYANSDSVAETAVTHVPTLRITLMDGTDIGATAAFEVGSGMLANLLGQLSERAEDQTFEDFVFALVDRCTAPKPAAKVGNLTA